MMKKILGLCLFLFSAAGLCFAEDPVLGRWLGVDDKSGRSSIWELYLMDDTLCGKIIAAPETPPDARAGKCRASYGGFPLPGKVNEMPVIGTPWIFGLSLERPGQWINGSIINPEDGKLYKCKITFHATDGKRYKTDTLEMRGEIGLGIGVSQFWQKSSAQEAAALR
jgi:uncharacterized protein (DUF2147 family)